MRYLLCFLLVGCSMLPDEFYIEAGPNPWDPRSPYNDPVDEYVGMAGFTWNLQPREVVISGQRDSHPWDIPALVGIHHPDAESGPIPLVVEDSATAKVADDIRHMRETLDSAKNEWDIINKTLLGGGGLSALVLLLLGSKALKATKKDG